MDWSPDRALTRRMALALVLTLLGYAVLLGPFVYLLPWQASLILCGVVVAVVGGLALEAGRLAYVVTRAIAIEREDYPQLFDTVDRLATQADMQPPPIAVIPTDEPNALSAGTGDRTVVCVTLGLLKELDGDEREAVLAHELAHLKNGDSSVLTVAGFPATVALGAMGAAVESMDGRALVLGYFGAAALLAFVSFVLVLVTLPGTLVLSRYRRLLYRARGLRVAARALDPSPHPRADPAAARTRRGDGVLTGDAARSRRPAGSCRFRRR